MNYVNEALNTYLALDQNRRANEHADLNQQSHALNLEAADQNIQINKHNLDAAKKTQRMNEFKVFAGSLNNRVQQGGYEAITPQDVARIMTYSELNPAAFLSRDYGQQLETVGQAIRGERRGNDPETLAAANVIWQQKIKRGVGQKTQDGKTIVDQKITGVVPAPDGKSVFFRLSNQTDDGAWYSAPMSEGRSADVNGDPYVKAVPLDELIQNVQGQQILYNLVNRKELANAVQGALQVMGGGMKSSKPRGLTYEQRVNLEREKTGLQSFLNGQKEAAASFRQEQKDKAAALKAENKEIANLIHAMRDEQNNSLGGGDYTTLDVMRAMAKAQVAPHRLNNAERKLVAAHEEGRRQKALQALYDKQWKEMTHLGGFWEPSPADVIDALVKKGIPRDEFAFMGIKSDKKDQSRLGGVIKGGAIGALGGPAGVLSGAVRGYLNAENASDKPEETQQEEAPANAPHYVWPPSPEAVEHLRKNPHLAPQFKQYYGRLPEGF